MCLRHVFKEHNSFIKLYVSPHYIISFKPKIINVDRCRNSSKAKEISHNNENFSTKSGKLL